MIENQVQGPCAIVDQIFKMDIHHGGLIQPAKIGREASGDVWEFDPSTRLRAGIQLRPSQNADLEARVEIGQGLIVGVVDVVRLHLGDVENVRDGHVAGIAVDEVGHEIMRYNAFYGFRTGEQVCRCNIARLKGSQPAQGLLGGTLASAFALVFGVERMQAAGEGRDAAEAEQDLVEQVRAALGKGDAEQDWPTVFRRGQGCEAGALASFSVW